MYSLEKKKYILTHVRRIKTDDCEPNAVCQIHSSYCSHSTRYVFPFLIVHKQFVDLPCFVFGRFLMYDLYFCLYLIIAIMLNIIMMVDAADAADGNNNDDDTNSHHEYGNEHAELVRYCRLG